MDSLDKDVFGPFGELSQNHKTVPTIWRGVFTVFLVTYWHQRWKNRLEKKEKHCLQLLRKSSALSLLCAPTWGSYLYCRRWTCRLLCKRDSWGSLDLFASKEVRSISKESTWRCLWRIRASQTLSSLRGDNWWLIRIVTKILTFQRERYIGGKALDTVVEEIAHPLGAIWLDRRWTSYQQLADRWSTTSTAVVQGIHCVAILVTTITDSTTNIKWSNQTCSRFGLGENVPVPPVGLWHSYTRAGSLLR